MIETLTRPQRTFQFRVLKPRYPGELIVTALRDLLEVFRRMAAEGGDICYARIGPRAVYLLNDPDLIREFLLDRNESFRKERAIRLTKVIMGESVVTSEGEYHRKHRSLMLPALHQRRIAGYAAEMVEVAERYSHAWQPGQVVAVELEMMRLTLEIVARTLFSADLREESHALGDAILAALSHFDRHKNPLAELFDRLPLPGTLRHLRARRSIDQTVYALIRKRRQESTPRSDLLSLLLEARDAETGKALTDAEVRDEAVTLFLTGHETTGVVLSWTWYLLARHPQVEEKLHAELDAVLGDRAPTFEDARRLPYTRQILNEALRLYPPVWNVGREVAQPVEIGGCRFPRGAAVVACQYTMQRDPRFWPDPERFEPERFTPELRASLPKYAYFPFSSGRRGCIGEQFAWTEGILVLATLAQRWRLRLIEEEPVGTRATITLRPQRSIPMRLERRA